MSSVVRWAADQRLLVLLAAILVTVAGLVSFAELPIDAVPDVTNIQVQVVTRAPALSAAEIELQITQPVERAMAGTPGLDLTRSVSKVGISIVTLIFADDIDIYFARAQVSERLAILREQIPTDQGTPELGPISTALGEIYMFELRPTAGSSPRSNEELRTIVEWQIAPRLRQVKGVIDVVGFGGATKQYRVTLDPPRLAAHRISVEEVRRALENDNAVRGGGYVEQNGEQVVIRGNARFGGLEDIRATLVRNGSGSTPIRVGQLGEVDTGPALRYGAMTRDGRGEIVGGSVLMLKGENSRDVVRNVKAAIEDLAPRLPAGLTIDPYYDRADFINQVLNTIAKNLGEGAALVAVCLLLTLGTLRAGLLVSGAIPFAMLVGVTGLRAIGYSGNVMSLGAIDFGIVVEGAVVVVEHITTKLDEAGSPERRLCLIVSAAAEVARPVVFAVLIVVLVFLPLAALEGIEGKMFRPVVFSLCFMLVGALAYALMVIPALAPMVFGNSRPAREPWLVRKLVKVYDPALGVALARPWLTLAVTAFVTAILIASGSRLGADFLPRIFEGSFAIDALRPPSTSLTQAIDLSTETERALSEVPEVITVVSRIGRPEGAVDPAGPESSDVFIMLKHQGAWRPGLTPDELRDELSSKVDKRVPATINTFSQPIEMRVNDLVAGARGDVAVKIYGEDLDAIEAFAERVTTTLASVRGAAGTKMEIVTGLPALNVDVDRSRAARLGIASISILDILSMTRGGQNVGRVREGERIFDLSLRIGGEEMKSQTDLERLPIMTSDGKLVPLALVADVKRNQTLVQIGREQLRRRILVQCNVRGRDVVGFVDDARAKVTALGIPRGVEVVWGGQFQNFLSARARLILLVPVALGAIAVMLAVMFRRLRYVVVSLLNLPFAAAGGLFTLVARGLPFSIPAGVGLIALSGVSVMNGVVMTNNLLREPDGTSSERVRRAAKASLRAIFSTALVAAIGFVPAAIATGTGAEVQRPLATVVIGGLIAAMVLSLPALPAMLLIATRAAWPARWRPARV
ncbi:MAG TPA: CusA/CzcA family heavy metal efflux RND transporter [Polyangiaceae bacterium]|nr:CusA/CzcA family heavy metal efflux RND transporter [Polyangiaceae bacterium]